MIEFVYRFAVRLFLPHLAKSLDQEDTASVFDGAVHDYVTVEDRGSDKTIFSFAGGAMLYAGLPAFEFRRMLTAAAPDYNLVFFRDLTRFCYHIRPDGDPSGLEFYEAEIRRTIEQLGSRTNVAIGASAGASASFYFGTRCGFDRIVTFGEPFPIRAWAAPAMQLYNLFNLKKLLIEPGAYAENALLSIACVWLKPQLERRVGPENIWKPLDTYIEATRRPRATLFFGARCRPDAQNAERLRGIPEVNLVSLPVGLHNCASYLKKQGTLTETIARALKESTDREVIGHPQ